MSVSYVGSDSGASGLATVTSQIRSVPAGTTNGDRMFAAVCIANEAATITPPAGWSEITLPVNETDHEFRLYTRVAASEPASYTWTYSAGTSAVSGIVTMRGVASFTATNNVDALSVLAHPTPSVVVASPTGSGLLTFFSAQSLLALGWTAPAGMTERWDLTGGLLALLNANMSADTQTGVAAGSYSRSGTSLDLVASINTIVALEASKFVDLPQAVETDTAQSLTAQHSLALPHVIEADTAQTLSPLHQRDLVQVLETDTATAPTGRHDVLLAQALETDSTPGAVTVMRSITVPQVIELDLTDTLMPARSAGISLAVEDDTAVPVIALFSGQLPMVVEDDEALDAVPVHSKELESASELDYVSDNVTAAKLSEIEQAEERDFVFVTPQFRGGMTPVTTPQLYTPGPCDPWPVQWPRTCDLTGVSPAITGAAVEAASEFLYQATAQRFGLCSVALRPCREECFGYGWPGWANWWNFGTYPQPYWYNGTWFNMGCGQCTSGCSCTAISETFLPGPVYSVVSVKVDGVTLVNGTDYRVDDYRKLVRLGGVLWPYCNDLNLDSTQVGTWEVIAQYGEPVPTLGELAVGQIACYFVDFLNGVECELPAGITDLSRQGISMSFQNVDNGLTAFYAQFPIANLFIKTYNPHGLMARAQAYDLDGPDFRAVGTA